MNYYNAYHMWIDPLKDNPIYGDGPTFKNTEALNMKGSSVAPFVGSFVGNANFVWIKLGDIKKYYISRFKYEGDIDKIPFYKMEEYLFQFGKVAIAKYGDEYVVGDFKVNTYDINMEPEIIEIIPMLEAKSKKDNDKKKTLKNPTNPKLSKKFVVGKDAIIFSSGPGFLTNDKVVLTPFIKNMQMLEDLKEIYSAILTNVYTGRTTLALPGHMSKNILKKIELNILSNGPIIPIGDTGDILDQHSILKDQILDFKDRTNELIDNYNFILEQILTMNGCNTNANNMKRERQTPDEITVNNDFSNGIVETERLYREYGLKELNRVFHLNVKIKSKKDIQEQEQEYEKSDIIQNDR